MDSIKLTDEQMRAFIRDGYIEVKPDLPPEFHTEMFAKIDEVIEKEGNPGNNILPRIPELQTIYDDPKVHGALQSIAGDDYYAEPHRHVHSNPPHSEGQPFHKDSFTRRRHHTRWLVTFYYPQDTPLEMGPTGVLPGTQYTNLIPEDSYDREIGTAGEAGRVVIANYDIVHRAMPNGTDKKRYMVKFLFNRMSEPTAPNWDNSEAIWGSDQRAEYEDVRAHVWGWHRAEGNSASRSAYDSVDDLIFDLKSDSEPTALKAAYTLAKVGESAVGPLIDTLLDSSAETWYSELMRRPPGRLVPSANASHALAAMGEGAVPGLVDTLGRSSGWDKKLVVQTLGDIGLAAKEALPWLLGVASDTDPIVRIEAAEALGQVVQDTSEAVPTLIDLLSDEDGDIRRIAALSLAKLKGHAVEAVTALAGVLNDSNRYVIGNAFEALRRIGTPEATEVLVKHLMAARWCPVTRPGSLF
jgi:HEAT repeat protein